MNTPIIFLFNAEERWAAVGYPGHLYGTVNGGLGLLVQVSPVLFAFLKEIEFRLSNLVVPVGGFSHDTWRAFKADREIKMSHNFVDGDLIETVTDLNMDDKAKLVKGLRIPMKLKLKKHWTMGRTISQKFNTAFLRDTDKLNKFKIVLSNKFQTFLDLLNGEGTTVESNWKGIKESITSTCHEVLGHKKHHPKEWITVDTLDKIQERRNKKAAINTSRTRAEKAKAQAEYTEVNKQVKKSIRTDKRKYVEDLPTTAKKAAREGNMRQLHDTTKKLS
ncbi:unnamed protein product, partial [Schistosoma mattheei]